ncbi:hypothetical protein R3W88_033186 [Solanum pinnatisectum]|uniref:Uncharacterized protein n=1 Tax=Solanum pinnatisectum TaxID=50273 RepID=A0AAV9K3J6_9SOLN|nr:hypothetical protein R3W88_033186 [Solanum pinnatisectum]
MEKEKGEASNLELSFSVIRKNVVDVLDFMEMLKNEEDQKAGVVNLIEKLQLELAFICTYVQLPHSVLEEFEDIMTGKRQEVENLFRSILCDVEPNVGIKYDIHDVVTRLRDNLDYFISSHHRSKSSATMTDEQLNFLFLNLHHLLSMRLFRMYVAT